MEPRLCGSHQKFVGEMQRDDDRPQDTTESDDSGRTGAPTRRRGGSGLDSIVSGLREQEERRKRSTPRSGNDPENS